MKRSPFRELAEVVEAERTGELIAATSSTEIHVHLKRGRIAWATASGIPFAFAQFIKRRCNIDDAAFRHVVEECRRDRLPLAETLVAWGLAEWEDVSAALRHQVKVALVALAELTDARTLFLERPHYAEHGSMSVHLGSLMAELPRRPSSVMPRVSVGPTARPGYCADLLGSVEGAVWIDLLAGDLLLDGAPPSATGSRVPRALARTCPADDVDFLAFRTARGSLIGVRLAASGRAIWCGLGADSTFGSAVATLTAIEDVRMVVPTPGTKPLGGAIVDVAGGETSATLEARTLLERAGEVVAVAVLEDDHVRAAVARDAVDSTRVLELFRRRRRLFRDATADDSEPPPSSVLAPMETIGFTTRMLVTGEPEGWCYGAELFGAPGRTLWLLTARSAAQGLGWACVTSLSRGLAALTTEARSGASTGEARCA